MLCTLLSFPQDSGYSGCWVSFLFCLLNFILYRSNRKFMFLSCYFLPQITMSLIPIIWVTFEIREKKNVSFILFLLTSMCSEHEIISHWHPLSWKSSEFLYLLTLSGIILGFESLPKYNSRQGRHLGVFMILFKCLCTSITCIIVISGHSTACKSRVSASGFVGYAMACIVTTHATVWTVSMELHQEPREASECQSTPCKAVSLLAPGVNPQAVHPSHFRSWEDDWNVPNLVKIFTSQMPMCICSINARVFQPTCVHVPMCAHALMHDNLGECLWFKICCVITLLLNLNCVNILRPDTELMIQEAKFILLSGEIWDVTGECQLFHSISDSSARPSL